MSLRNATYLCAVMRNCLPLVPYRRPRAGESRSPAVPKCQSRVRRDLMPVVIGAAEALATGFAAHRPCRVVFRWLEDPLTVAASPFDHTGGYRTGGVSTFSGKI